MSFLPAVAVHGSHGSATDRFRQKQPQRGATMPNPSSLSLSPIAQFRALSPAPQSAPPQPTKPRPERPLINQRARRSMRSVNQVGVGQASVVADRASKLQEEVERLEERCREHELKIRSARSTIEHRLFNELPEMIGRLTQTDVEAEETITKLQSTLTSTLPAAQTRLDSLLSDRARDLQTMRERFTPWQGYLREYDRHHEEGNASGVSKALSAEGEGFGRVERWAEEVETFLTGEILRLKREQARGSRKWSGFIVSTLGVLAVLLSMAMLFMVGTRIAQARHGRWADSQ